MPDFEGRTKSIQDSLVEVEEIQDGLFWINYQPGNGTAYRCILQTLPAGSPPAKWLFGEDVTGTLVTFMPDFRYRPFAFADGSYLSREYLKEKIGCSYSDAAALAELFAYFSRFADPESTVTADSAEETP
jgi:hypothetical protein